MHNYTTSSIDHTWFLKITILDYMTNWEITIIYLIAINLNPIKEFLGLSILNKYFKKENIKCLTLILKIILELKLLIHSFILISYVRCLLNVEKKLSHMEASEPK